MGQKRSSLGWLALAAIVVAAGAAAQATGGFTLKQALSYPFISEVAGAPQGSAVAWARDVEGVRNIWFAAGPGFAPRQ